MTRERARRWFLRSTAALAAVGLAGCSSSDDGGATEETTTEEPTDVETTAPPQETETATETVTEQQRTQVADPQAVIDEWLQGVSNYDGRVVFRPGETQRSVTVGVERPSGDTFGYGPAAIRITEGTTVQWQWSGEGGAHSVTEVDGAFDSGEPVSGSGNTFSVTFEQPGVYRYRCKNHGGAANMKGAVIVTEQQTLSGYPTVDEWLEGYDFDGTLSDRRDESSVDITVGASGNEGYFAFDPNALYVERGTEIVFEWTGRGGAHDVTWEDADLGDSESTSSAAKTYAVTIDEPGVYLYSCGSHAPTGGRGAIVVGD